MERVVRVSVEGLEGVLEGCRRVGCWVWFEFWVYRVRAWEVGLGEMVGIDFWKVSWKVWGEKYVKEFG